MKNHTNSLKLVTFIVGLFSMVFLVSCSSSSQLASSFGKRKYMPGHFYDPVAKIKTICKPNVYVAEAGIAHNVGKKEVAYANELLEEINAKPLKSFTKSIVVVKRKQFQRMTATSFSAIASGNSSDIKVASPETITTYKHGSEGDHTRGVPLGRFLLYMILIALLFLLLAFAVGGSNPVFFAVLIAGAVIFFIIAALVLVIYLVLKNQQSSGK